MRHKSTEQLKDCRILAQPEVVAHASAPAPARWVWSGDGEGVHTQCLFLDGRHIATVYRGGGHWFWRRIGFSEAPLAAGSRQEARQLAVFHAARLAGGG